MRWVVRSAMAAVALVAGCSAAPTNDKDQTSELKSLESAYWSGYEPIQKRLSSPDESVHDLAQRDESRYLHDYQARFRELARAARGSDVEVSALLWVAALGWRAEGEDGRAAVEAVDALLERHIDSNRLGALADRLQFEGGPLAPPDSHRRLRVLASSSPHPDVRAKAMLSLGGLLVKSESGEAKLEGRELLERLCRECADTAEMSAAKALLFELDHLQVGMMSPDFDAMDQDGKSFRLSDYRGKVVLLVFWGFW